MSILQLAVVQPHRHLRMNSSNSLMACIAATLHVSETIVVHVWQAGRQLDDCWLAASDRALSSQICSSWARSVNTRNVQLNELYSIFIHVINTLSLPVDY